jgi:signal transduction histidine kinase
MMFSCPKPASDSWIWRVGPVAAAGALGMAVGLLPIPDATVPFAAAAGLAVFFGINAVRLSHRNTALLQSGAEGWTVAASAREELRRAQERYEQTVQQLRNAHDEAVAANQARSMFMASMSHELRTPLNAVIGFSEILELGLYGTLGSERNKEYVRDIKESGQHLLTMINDILDLSKIDAGRMELYETTVDVARLIQACCRIMRPRAEEARVRFSIELPEGRPLYIRADEVRLKQVLFNLLSNAVKFTRAGGQITVGADECDCGEVVITIRDTGIGIRAEDMALVFEPFRQADNSMTRKAGGTGLGLPLSKALVELHGGRLTMVSRVGEGTEVSIALPNLIAELPSSPAASAAKKGEGPERVLDWLVK